MLLVESTSRSASAIAAVLRIYIYILLCFTLTTWFLPATRAVQSERESEGESSATRRFARISQSCTVCSKLNGAACAQHQRFGIVCFHPPVRTLSALSPSIATIKPLIVQHARNSDADSNGRIELRAQRGGTGGTQAGPGVAARVHVWVALCERPAADGVATLLRVALHDGVAVPRTTVKVAAGRGSSRDRVVRIIRRGV